MYGMAAVGGISSGGAEPTVPASSLEWCEELRTHSGNESAPERRDQSTCGHEDVEWQCRTGLPSKRYAVIRVDVKCFSTCSPRMQTTTHFLCVNIDGAHFVYTQSHDIYAIAR